MLLYTVLIVSTTWRWAGFEPVLFLFLCDQVTWLRSQFPSLDIEVDGGVGPDTIHKCAEVSSTNTYISLITNKTKKFPPKIKNGVSLNSMCLLIFTLGWS